MGWATICEPGTDLGPCEEACTHPDCAMTRLDAQTKCITCLKPIGYETPYYGNRAGVGPQPTRDENTAEHASCLQMRLTAK